MALGLDLNAPPAPPSWPSLPELSPPLSARGESAVVLAGAKARPALTFNSPLGPPPSPPTILVGDTWPLHSPAAAMVTTDGRIPIGDSGGCATQLNASGGGATEPDASGGGGDGGGDGGGGGGGVSVLLGGERPPPEVPRYLTEATAPPVDWALPCGCPCMCGSVAMTGVDKAGPSTSTPVSMSSDGWSPMSKPRRVKKLAEGARLAAALAALPPAGQGRLRAGVGSR